MSVVPRRQSYLYPAGTRRIAVVRIEAPGAIAGDGAVCRGGDPRRSWRPRDCRPPNRFRRPAIPTRVLYSASARPAPAHAAQPYRSPLRRSPPGATRTTGSRRFLSDEGPCRCYSVWSPADALPRPDPEFRIREPLCETTPASPRASPHDHLAGKRVYVFADAGWREDLHWFPPSHPSKGPSHETSN